MMWHTRQLSSDPNYEFLKCDVIDANKSDAGDLFGNTLEKDVRCILKTAGYRNFLCTSDADSEVTSISSKGRFEFDAFVAGDVKKFPRLL